MEQEKVLLKWTAKSRPYRQGEFQSKQVFVVLGALVGLILLFAREWMLMMLLAAGGFYYYAINRIPPDEVEYQITNKGIKAFGRLYLWWEFSRWWWVEKWGFQLIGLDTQTSGFGRLFIPVDKGKVDEIEKLLNKQVLFEKPEVTWMDNLWKWLMEKFPLQNKI